VKDFAANSIIEQENPSAPSPFRLNTAPKMENAVTAGIPYKELGEFSSLQ
jgi:hypothetical protein